MIEIAQTLNIKALISSMFPNHFHNSSQRLALLIEMTLQYKFKAACMELKAHRLKGTE